MVESDRQYTQRLDSKNALDIWSEFGGFQTYPSTSSGRGGRKGGGERCPVLKLFTSEGLAALHRGVVSLQYGIVRLYRGIVGLQ
jgi:hypothetical protein